MNKKDGSFNKLNFRTGIKDGLPIGLGYLSVSFAFGVQASLLGVPWFMSLFISATNLTSAGQLAGLTVIASAGTIFEIFASQLVINARYFLMSISLSQKLDKSFSLPHRLLCSAFVTDEIFAVSVAKPLSLNRKYFYGLVLLPYFGWSLGTLSGALLGNVLPSTISNALGLALYAMFIAIIIPPSLSKRGVFPAVLFGAGFSCALFFIPIFKNLPSGLGVIISALLSALITALIFPIKINKESEEE